MSNDAVMEQLVQMQTRIAYQEHMLASLDEVVREFAGRVETLERELGLLRSSMRASNDTGPSDEPPPHYGWMGIVMLSGVENA